MMISGTSLNCTGLPWTSTLPAPTVNQTNRPRIPYNTRASRNLRSEPAPLEPAPLLSGRGPGSSGFPVPNTSGCALLPNPAPQFKWCTGEDSNLRSSKERQIYSLLPLTARPPVPIVSGCQTRCSPATPSNLFHPSRLPIEAGAPEHTYLAGDSPARSEHAPDAGSPRRKGSAFNNLRRPNCRFKRLFPAFHLWSWRRDLNPRPSDYKSDALPAELRQPFLSEGRPTHSGKPGKCP